ncbi:muconate/chloromuconate family cycloisomerase [Mesorhizobium loti]|uniref:Mandelate racemase n=1 Tax=Mesorhizobium loti R88b TaxID=935548 RepID=A0A6M7WHQ8_RHILI|nr:muconate/chloromuconate family cycloisomerase [Mesorhizobium loti]QKD01952.1 mandelate racemase [Mesorhizobium loti R88b]
MDLTVRAIESWIVDVPTARPHKLSNTQIACQSYVIVRVTLACGETGYGEAATLGGPRWSESSVESIKANIDVYLAPAVLGIRATDFELASLLMASAAQRNFAAKAAVESALFDAAGRALGLPASLFLGGQVRNAMEVIWALASGDADQEIEEARAKLAAREHRTFKVKIGFREPREDISRLRRILDAIGGEARVIVDINQGWSEATALRFLPELAEMGIALIEQPCSALNMEAMARLAGRSNVPLMVDEAAFTGQDVIRAGTLAAGSVLSLKLVKSGGLIELKRAAGIAAAFGFELYGGCLLESGIGTAAHLAVFSSLPRLEWGTEHFGPRILVEDLIRGGIVYRDFQIHCPEGPGLGIEVNEDTLSRLARKT